MASAQTGTGKTAGFTLPLLQRLIQNEPHAKGRRPVRALILTPTRELAAQVGENVRDYSKYLNIRSLVVFGGVSINPQMMKLRGGVDILVATRAVCWILNIRTPSVLIKLKSSCWTKRTVCWIWALSMTSVAYWPNCRRVDRTCCSRRPSPTDQGPGRETAAQPAGSGSGAS
nr:ATP-dependent RNA helicase rhlE [Klebsiella pneumoniae]